MADILPNYYSIFCFYNLREQIVFTFGADRDYDDLGDIYYYDIGQYAAHNRWLMTETPEINPNGNAHDQIQANIYEAICEGLYEHIAEKESEDD